MILLFNVDNILFFRNKILFYFKIKFVQIKEIISYQMINFVEVIKCFLIFNL